VSLRRWTFTAYHLDGTTTSAQIPRLTKFGARLDGEIESLLTLAIVKVHKMSQRPKM
jgi:hypothetical protein